MAQQIFVEAFKKEWTKNHAKCNWKGLIMFAFKCFLRTLPSPISCIIVGRALYLSDHCYNSESLCTKRWWEITVWDFSCSVCVMKVKTRIKRFCNFSLSILLCLWMWRKQIATQAPAYGRSRSLRKEPEYFHIQLGVRWLWLQNIYLSFVM